MRSRVLSFEASGIDHVGLIQICLSAEATVSCVCEKNSLPVSLVILLHEKFLQFDWLRAVVFQLNLKYLHVKITDLLWVVV